MLSYIKKNLNLNFFEFNFNDYTRDLQAAGKIIKRKNDDHIVNRNTLIQDYCSKWVKGINDGMFFNTVLVHSCTIESRINPQIQGYITL